MLFGFAKGYCFTDAEKDNKLSGFEKGYCLTNAEKKIGCCLALRKDIVLPMQKKR